jgi:hypothetical protein
LGIKQGQLSVAEQNAATSRLNASTTRQNDLANQQLRARGLSISQQNNLANQALKSEGLSITQQNDLANQALKQAALNAKNAAKGQSKPLTPPQQNSVYSTIDKLKATIHTMQQPVCAAQAKALLAAGIQIQTGGRLSEQQIRGILYARYDSHYVQAGYELLGYGFISPSTAAYLHASGLRGGRYQVATPASGGFGVIAPEHITPGPTPKQVSR